MLVTKQRQAVASESDHGEEEANDSDGDDLDATAASSPAASTAVFTHPDITPAFAAAVQTSLISHYRAHRRPLPWRGDAAGASPEELAALSTPPTGCSCPAPRSVDGTVSAYGTWVSEVMLQQTRISSDICDRWRAWMRTWPCPHALAAAPSDAVTAMWAGLGYYRRAALLHKGAQYVLTSLRGVMPCKVAELEKIPGIGAYTAGAIASIAHGVSAPVVDGNVVRVFSRLFRIPHGAKSKEMQSACWRIARALVPPASEDNAPGAFNQALMEHGALVCTPTKPQCGSCVLRTAGVCAAFNASITDVEDAADAAVSSRVADRVAAAYPVKSEKRVVPTYSRSCVCVCVHPAGTHCAAATNKYAWTKVDTGEMGEDTKLLRGQWRPFLFEPAGTPAAATAAGVKRARNANTERAVSDASVCAAVRAAAASGMSLSIDRFATARVTDCGTTAHAFSHVKHNLRVYRVCVDEDAVAGLSGVKLCDLTGTHALGLTTWTHKIFHSAVHSQLCGVELLLDAPATAAVLEMKTRWRKAGVCKA